MPSTDSIHVVGGGLAGSEAAWQLARRGLPVVLHEMRPVRTTAAHSTGDLAELVCSNALGSRMPHTAPGVFKAELRQLGSLVLSAADAAAVAAGGALAVDRGRFSAAVEERLLAQPSLEIRRGEVTELLAGQRTIVATGPLTSDRLAEQLAGLTGREDLYFYDAIAPIVDLDSIDEGVGFWANRYEPPGSGDYYNLPLNQDEYEAFVDALLAGDQVPARDFEQERFFQGCQPIEAIAAKGRESLRHGPMKPVGLDDPRTGRWPWAVLQLRRETARGSAMNLVGFQTRLRYGAQREVFGQIPGLAGADFLRLGSVHRNTYLNAPRHLDAALRLKVRPELSLAGQLVGCEGYTESSGLGLWAALNVVAERQGRELAPPPRESMTGALLAWLREVDPDDFHPMNVNFGLLEPRKRARGTSKKEHRLAWGRDCVSAFEGWARDQGVLSPLPERG